MTENDGAERSGNEGRTKRGHRSKQRGLRVTTWEENQREDRYRCGGVDIEIVEFDGCADDRGQDDFPAGTPSSSSLVHHAKSLRIALTSNTLL